MEKKPSYIDRMEHFIINDRLRLSHGEIKLYLLLFHLNNRAMWAEWFEADNVTLMAGTRLREGNMIRAKNGLKAKGLIDVQAGRRGKPSRYRLSTSSNTETLSKYTVKNESESGKYTLKNDNITESITESETGLQSLEPQGLADPLRHKTKDNIRANDFARGLFETFWKAYPKHKNRYLAERAFLKLNPSEELLEIMLKAVERQKHTDQWQKEGGKYIPCGEKWINGRMWEDEPEEEKKPPSPSHVLTPEERVARQMEYVRKLREKEEQQEAG